MTAIIVGSKVIVGGNVADSNAPAANAVVISQGRIAAIGSDNELRRPGLDVIGHPGGIISPALHDHHFHPIGYVAAVTRLTLKDARDLDDLGDRLRDSAAGLKEGASLIGNRLDDEGLAERRLPTREELDGMVPDHPVLLYRYCGHVAVVNSAALKLAGLAPDSPGILKEAEIQPVANAVAASQAPIAPGEAFRALNGLPGLGISKITAIVSAADPVWCEVPDEIGTLLGVAPGLPIDFDVLVIANSPAELKEAAGRINDASRNVSFLGWKEFADGSLGGHTAALYEPYSDDPDNRGIVRLDTERARIMARACLSLGGTVAIHAIGDLANDRVLDLFEVLIREGADPGMFRIEHASVLSDTAIERMAELGVTASVQPAFLASEAGWLGVRLGARTARTYSLAAMRQAGIRLVGGSDCPVEPPNPWWGMASAEAPGGLSRRAAFGLFSEHLAVGDPANFLILDRDPISTNQLAATKVLAAYRAGNNISLTPELPFT